jgi:WD40 repeat protein
MRHRSIASSIVACFLFSGSLFAAPPEPRYKLVLQTPPATAVNSVAVSPDGALVATAAGEGGVRLYDARTGALSRALGDVGDRCVVFSPDGRTIAAAGFHMDKLLGVYDVATGKRVLALAGHTEWEVDAIAFSPDGKLLASTGTDKQVLVFDLASGQLRHQLKNQPQRSPTIAFSPDGKSLACGGGDRAIRLFDVASGELRRTISGHRDWVATLDFAANGNFLVSGSCDWGFHRGHDWSRPGGGSEPSEWRLWHGASGKLERTVPETGRLLTVRFSPDGKRVACGVDRVVKLYDVTAPGEGRVAVNHAATVTCVAFTPDGNSLISGSHDQTVKRTNLATGNLEWQAPGHFEQVNSVSLSADGALLVTGSSDHRFARGRIRAGAKEFGPGAVRLWDIRTGRMLRRLGDSTFQVMAVAMSADSQRVAAGGATVGDHGAVQVWRAETGKLEWSVSGAGREILATAFTPDGSLLAAAAADGTAKIYDAATGAIKHILAGHQGGGTSIAFSPDGKTVICGQGYGGARIWDVATGRLERMCKVDESRPSGFTTDRVMNSIGLSRDGRLLATCNSSINNELTEPVRLWNPRTGAIVRDFTAENIHGRPMALSPDGSIIATGGKSVKLWDVRSGKLVRELFGHLKRTQSIVFSADGRLLVSGGSYGTTNVWEVASGRLLATLFAFSDSRESTNSDQWLAYHPNGHYTGSERADEYILWRVGDELRDSKTIGEELRRPEHIEAALTGFAPTRLP